MGVKAEAALEKLTTEVSETRTVIASAVTYIKGVPGVVQAAVDEALATAGLNDLTPEQEAAFAGIATSLDEGQQEVIAALTENTPTKPPQP